MMQNATLALAAAVAAAVAGTSAAAPAPDETGTLLQLASGITRLKIQEPLTVVRPAEAAARTRRAALAARLYPARSRAHDAAIYHALGLAPSAAAARAALEAAPSAGTFYDIGQRRLVSPPDARPSRHTLLREVTTGLLDEHFELGRSFRRAGDRDGLAAARGAWEGYARLVAQLVTEPPPAPQGSGRLGRFLALEEGFYGSRAVRFAAELRNLGSNRAVYTALKAFPASTEQVFHLDRFLERERPRVVALPEEADGLRLASSDSFGELSVRALLATAGVRALDRAATGWGGGRSGVYRADGREGFVLALDWDTPADAGEWAAAVVELESLLAGRAYAFARADRRTVLAVASDAAAATALAQAVSTTSTSS